MHKITKLSILLLFLHIASAQAMFYDGGRLKALCAMGLSNEVEKLLEDREQRIHIDTQEPGTLETPLIAAANSPFDNFRTVVILMTKFPDRKLKDRNGLTALMHAARRGHMGVIRLLANDVVSLDYPEHDNPDIDHCNDRDNFGMTALAHAVFAGHYEAARQLIKIGADTNIPNNNGDTPLMLAVEAEISLDTQIRLIELLLENRVHKANPDLQDKAGNTALMIAASQNMPEVIAALIKSSDPNIKNHRGQTALMLAAKGRSRLEPKSINMSRGMNLKRRMIYEGNPEAISALLNNRPGKKIEINAEDKDGDTAVFHAIQEGFGFAQSLQILLNAGARPDTSLDHSRAGRLYLTPLMEACSKGYLSLVEILLNPDYRAELNLQDPYLQTALWHAIDSNEKTQKTQIALLLLNRGANPTINNIYKKTILMRAAEMRNDRIVDALLKSPHGIDIDAMDKFGFTALRYEISNGVRLSEDQLAEINEDLKHKREPKSYSPTFDILAPISNIDLPDNLGVTPLMAAVRKNHPGKVAILKKLGADLNYCDNSGTTAIALASSFPDRRIDKTKQKLGTFQKVIKHLPTMLRIKSLPIYSIKPSGNGVILIPDTMALRALACSGDEGYRLNDNDLEILQDKRVVCKNNYNLNNEPRFTKIEALIKKWLDNNTTSLVLGYLGSSDEILSKTREPLLKAWLPDDVFIIQHHIPIKITLKYDAIKIVLDYLFAIESAKKPDADDSISDDEEAKKPDAKDSTPDNG